MMQRMIRDLFRNRRIFVSILFTALLSAYAAAEGRNEIGEGAEHNAWRYEGSGDGPEGPEGGNDGGGEEGPQDSSDSGGEGPESPEDGNDGVGEGPESPEDENNGGGEEGPESPEDGGNDGGGEEGPEGPEDDGNDGGGTNVPFVSSGLSRGVFESPILALNETFAGLLNDTEIAVTFDEANEKFVGRIRNEGPEPVCDVKVAVMLDDGQVINTTLSGNPLQVDGLLTGGRQDFEFPVVGTTFNGEHRSGASWTAMVETFTCDSAPTVIAGGDGSDDGSGGCSGSPEGPEGANEGGGGEGPEGGNEGGGESGDESSPPIPLSDPFSGVFQNQNFTFAFDASTGAFRGTVENPTNNFICQSRTEIHLGVGTQVIELGPTIPEDLGPGEILNVVMSADGVAPDTYTLHPESSPCP